MEPRTLNDRTRYAYQFFLKRGYSNAAAAGIVGNLMVESGSFADDVISGKRRGDNGSAHYIAQWRHGRLANLNAFAKSKGRAPTDFETQLAFVDHEMRTASDAGAGRAFKLLQDPGISGNRAAAAFMQHFERPNKDPAINHIAKRQSHAATLLGLPPQPDVQLPAVNSALTHANNPGDYTVNNQGQTPFNSVVPTMNETNLDRFKEEQRAEENRAGLLEGTKIAVMNNWSVLTPFRALGHHDPDPSFVMDDARIKKYGENVPNQYLKELEDAVSDQHAEAIRGRILKQLDDNQRLADMGWTGTALNVGAALTDPGAIAVAMALNAATKGIGGTAFMLARAGMATRIAIGAAEGVIANVATEAPLIAVDPTRDLSLDEMKFAIGSGLVFGGAFGALAKNPHMSDVADGIEKIGNDLRNSTAFSTGSVGAATVGVKAGPSDKVLDLLQDFRDIDPEGKFLGVRYDVTGQLLASKNPMTRSIAQFLGEDGVRSAKGKVTEQAATEVQNRLFRVAQAQFTEGFETAWQSYRKANGIGALRNGEEMREFGAKVFDYIREPNASVKETFDPAVKQAAAAFSGQMKNFWKMANDAGITLSENGVQNYVPRYVHQSRAMEMIEEFGEEGIAEFYMKAIVKAQPDIDPDLALAMGNAVVQRMVKMQAGEAYMGMGRLNFDFDEITEELGTFLAPTEIANLKQLFDNAAAKPDPTGAPRMKHRIRFDEQFNADIRSVHGHDVPVNMSDFYIKDPITAFSLYSRNMSGQIALADIKVHSAPDWEGKTHLLVDGIKSRADWEKLKQQVRQTGRASKADIEKDIQNLDFLYSAVTGTPLPGINRGSDWNTFLRMMKDYNFIRVLNQVGFSQLPEFGRVTAQAGVTTMMQAVPSFRHFLDMARGGRMTDDLADEIRGMFAPGTDYLRSTYHIDADDFGTPITQGTQTRMQRFAGKVQPKLHTASRFTATMSGMRHINQLLQTWSARAAAVKFTKMAMFGEKIDWNRMKTLGLRDEDTKAIMEEIKKNARFTGGIQQPSKLEALGLDGWATSTRVKFENAMFRLNRTMVLENDPGQLAKWMQHPFGSVVIQFRSFVYGSWTKAFLQGINMKDKQAAAGFLTSALIGTLVYAAQQHINTIGDPDRAEKLAERLSIANLAAAGFSRTSESSLLPMLIDTPLYFATNGEKALFNTTRSSGLSSDALNFPALDLANSAMNGVAGVTSIPYGSPFTRKDFGNLRRTLPFQNMLGVNNFLNWISSGLPSREPRAK